MKLTEDGKNDYDKVKHVPGLFEVVESEGKYLENALRREDDNESHVEVVQGKVPHVVLMVVVKRHSEHVQEDK